MLETAILGVLEITRGQANQDILIFFIDALTEQSKRTPTEIWKELRNFRALQTFTSSADSPPEARYFPS